MEYHRNRAPGASQPWHLEKYSNKNHAQKTDLTNGLCKKTKNKKQTCNPRIVATELS